MTGSVAEARVLLARARFQDAESLARRALAAKPDAQEFQYLLALALLEQGRQDEGADVVSLILSEPPATPAARELFGELLGGLKAAANRLMYWNRFSEAQALLDKAAAPLAGDAAAWFLRGKLLRFQHRLKEAQQAYRKSAALDPKSLLTPLYLSETLLLAGKVPAVLEVLKEAAARCPEPAEDDVPGALLRYRLAVCRQEFEEAARRGEALLGKAPALARVEQMLWPIFVEDFDYFPRPQEYLRRGLSRASEYLKKEPRSAWAAFYHLHAFRYTHHDFTPEVTRALLDDCARLADAGKPYAWMRYQSGNCRLALSEFAGAADDFSAAAAGTKPPSWRARGYLGEARVYQGKRALAWRAFDRALREAPDDAAREEVRAWKAKGLLWSGEAAAALAALEKTGKAGSLRDAYALKAGALVLLGRHAQALKVADEGLAEFPVEEARVWRLEALLRLGRAREVFEATEGAERANFYFRLLRGLACAALGDAEGLRRETAAVPEHIADFARRKLRLPREERGAALLEGVLKLSGGVRRSGNQTALWMGRDG